MYTDYAYAVEEAMSSLGLTLLMNAGGSLMSIAVYVITALALYTIAKRREISKPWLAWIPIVNCWLLGSIADQYRYVARGEVKNKRKTLLWLQIISFVLTIAFLAAIFVMVFNMVQNVMMFNLEEEELLIEVMKSLGGVMGLLLPISGVSIAYMIVFYMALYDIYASCDPGNKTLYLVLSILFNIAQPICLMICRNKDLGMPPRKVLPGAGPQYGQYQAPQYGQYQQPQYQAPQYGQYQQPQYQPPQYQQPVTPPQPAAPAQAEPIRSTEELRTPDVSESPYSQWPDPSAPQHPRKDEQEQQ